MATSGPLTMGVKATPPIPPTLVTVKLAPCMSWRANFRARARSARSAISVAISRVVFRSASRTTGTKSPCSVSTATPTWT